MFRVPKLVLLSALFATAVVAAGCSSGPNKVDTPTTVKAVTTTTAQSLAATTVTLNGQTYPVPTEDGKTPITPFADSGQQVVLTTSGFLPRTLYSALHQPVVFTNLTSKVITLTVEDVGIAPATIEPGGHFSWIPNVLAFGYKSSTGDGGIVNVGAFQG
jgi:hypothetical protein